MPVVASGSLFGRTIARSLVSERAEDAVLAVRAVVKTLLEEDEVVGNAWRNRRASGGEAVVGLARIGRRG
jgi:hypothetical protein